jgi:hypothetical protein
MVTAAKADDTDFDLGLLGLKMQVQSFLLIFLSVGVLISLFYFGQGCIFGCVMFWEVTF